MSLNSLKIGAILSHQYHILFSIPYVHFNDIAIKFPTVLRYGYGVIYQTSN